MYHLTITRLTVHGYRTLSKSLPTTTSIQSIQNTRIKIPQRPTPQINALASTLPHILTLSFQLPNPFPFCASSPPSTSTGRFPLPSVTRFLSGLPSFPTPSTLNGVLALSLSLTLPLHLPESPFPALSGPGVASSASNPPLNNDNPSPTDAVWTGVLGTLEPPVSLFEW